jgi:hypothetical protein
MFGRKCIHTLLAIAMLALPSTLLAQSWVGAGQTWLGGSHVSPHAVCSACGKIGSLHDACCDFGAVCSDCCGCQPRWAASANFLWMGRNRADQLGVVFSDIGGTFFNELDVNDFGFNVGGGVSTSLTRQLESGRELEIRYLGVFDQTAPNSAYVDPTIVGFNSVFYLFFGNLGGTDNEYSAEYQSDLHSAEANLSFECRHGFVPFAGIRWMHVGEEFELWEVVAPSNGVLAETRNDLIGAQLGLQKDLWTHDRIRIETIVKLGVSHNSIDLHADEHTGGVPTAVLDRSFGETATAGEVQVTVVWQPYPHLAFRAGYNGLWLNDVAAVAN